MSCFKIYNNSFSNITDYPKVIGTLTDDFTGGTACLLPYKVVNTFYEKSGQDFIVPGRCEFNHPLNPDKSIKLEPTETGCRIDFSNKSRDEVRSQMEVLQALYDKNVVEKRLALEARLNADYEALQFTRSNFAEKKQKLDATTALYQREVADSNNLVIERNSLRIQHTQAVTRLRNIKQDIVDARKQADAYIDSLNKTIADADWFLSFVTVSEHPGFEGTMTTLTPQVYKWTNFGISSLIIPPGMTARIWVGENFDGESLKLDHTSGARLNLVETPFTETRYREELQEYFVQNSNVVEGFRNRMRSTPRLPPRLQPLPGKPKNYRKIQIPYQVQTNFNDRVACIEIQKEQSVGEWMDKWQKDI